MEKNLGTCDVCPAALGIFSNDSFVSANESFYNLFAKSEEDRKALGQKWFESYLSKENSSKFKTFLKDASSEILIEINLSDRISRKFRIVKKPKPFYLKKSEILLVFQNISSILDNFETYKAGFDEFLQVTLDLE